MLESARIAHLLRRTEYVARPARLAQLAGLSLEAAVDNILQVPLTPVPLPPYLDQLSKDQNQGQFSFAIDWWIDRMVDSPNPLQEKMAFFWHSHFTSSWRKVEVGFAMARQNRLWRDNALGNFRDLTQAMAIDPAMLLYLDSAQNVSGAANQNFARELMELFTLGVGNYTEADVAEAARAWTGYGINKTSFAHEYHPAKHDGGAKTIFNKTANWAGPELIDEILLNDPVKRLVAARYIVRKLWEYFAYQNPAVSLVESLAPGFAANWDVKALLRAMFLRDEFYSTQAVQGMVRTPVEWVVAVLYHSGIRSAQVNPRPMLSAMGQLPFDPPNVSGWRPNGYWVNTSAFGARATFAQRIAGLMRTNHVFDDIATLSVDEAVSRACAMFGMAEVSVTTQAALRQLVVARRAGDRRSREAVNLLTMAMLAPEMHAV